MVRHSAVCLDRNDAVLRRRLNEALELKRVGQVAAEGNGQGWILSLCLDEGWRRIRPPSSRGTTQENVPLALTTSAPSKPLLGTGLLRRAISSLDGYLSQQHGVAPFSDDERCILRIALMPAACATRLSDGAEIRPGDLVVDVHCWNERIPSMPKGGADLAWAQQVSVRLKYSLRLLTHELVVQPALKDARACRAKVNFVGQGCSNESVTRIISRLGFEDVDEGSGTLRTHVHDSLENILISALVWTHNPEALKREKMIRERRPVWSSRAKLLSLYGSSVEG